MKAFPCPVCGSHRICLREEIGLKRKAYHLECRICHFAAGNARSAWGAARIWNKVFSKPRERDRP